MEYVGEETMVEENGPDGDEGWVETHHFDSSNLTELEDNVCEMTLDSAKVVCICFFFYNKYIILS